MSALDEILKTANGARILKDWLGDGAVPVSPFLSASRAKICEGCPQNIEKDWWNRVTDAIATAIKGTLSIKNKAGLTVPNESQLFMCKNCGCALPLKVHVPIAHIAAHTKPEEYYALPDFCWQRKELSQLSNFSHLHD